MFNIFLLLLQIADMKEQLFQQLQLNVYFNR